MKYFLLFFGILFALLATAQDESVRKLKSDAEKTIEKPEDTLQLRWRKGGLMGLNIAQGSLSNWAAGGDEFSLSLNSLMNFYAFYKEGKNSFDFNADFSLGYLRTSSIGSRKNDDRFDILSKYGYAISPKLNAAALFNFRTQLFKGYTYPDNVKTFSSTFLSPAYILLSAGLDWKPAKDLSIFFSPATVRWIVVKDDSLSSVGLYGVEPGKHSRNEIGAFVSVNYLKEINKVLAYKGRLDLFSNYKRNPEKIDVLMANLFSVKISEVFSATWNIDLIYDDDVRLFGENGDEARVQLKSLVGVGLLVRY